MAPRAQAVLQSNTQSKTGGTTAPPRLGTFADFLVQRGLLSQEQVQELGGTGQKIGTLRAEILRRGLVEDEALAQAWASFLHLPYLDLRKVSIAKDLLELFPRESLQRYKMVPFARADGKVQIGLTDPTDLQALEALEFLSQKLQVAVEPYVVSDRAFEAVFGQEKSIALVVEEALQDIKAGEEVRTAQPLEDEMERLVAAAPISQIVDVLIRHAIESKASDIHLEPTESTLRIRFRMDGVLQVSVQLPKSVHPAVVSRIKILSDLKIDEQRLPQDGRFNIRIAGRSVDFRVSTLPTVNGEKVVLRVLDKTAGVPTFVDLGLTGRRLKVVEDNIRKPHGMFLVTGPTGSGKSTTLYSALSLLNQVGVNIVTLEDPVEYFIDGINQGQVKPEIGLTFASGLRSILRQDPNIIMVGEVRDRETAELAVHSALTGHLVLSTLHTNDAVGAVPRLVDMGIEPFLLTASLNAILAQRLVRKVCAHCVSRQPPTAEEARLLKTELTGVPEDDLAGIDFDKLTVPHAAGCDQCGKTGYKGRVGIYEALPIGEILHPLILSKAPAAQIEELARKNGMITMRQDGFLKVARGATTIEEVLRVTSE